MSLDRSLPLFGRNAASCIQCDRAQIVRQANDTALICSVEGRAVPWGHQCDQFALCGTSRPARMWDLLFPNSPAGTFPVQFDAFERELQRLDKP